MHQYLFHDVSRIYLSIAPENHDVYSYEDFFGQLVHATMSVHAEKVLIRSVALNTSVRLSKADGTLV